MRLDTTIWIRMESKGHPADTAQFNCTIRDAVLKIAQWLSSVYMGSHIIIKLARSEADLNSMSAKRMEMEELGRELEDMLNRQTIAIEQTELTERAK